jgi:titin
MAVTPNITELLEELNKVRQGFAYKIVTTQKYLGTPSECAEDKICEVQILYKQLISLQEELERLQNDPEFDPNSSEYQDLLQFFEELENYYYDEILDNNADGNSLVPEIRVVYPVRNFSFSARTNTSITLSWLYDSVADTKFILEYSLDGITYEPLGETTEKEFLHDGLTYNTLYYYRIFVEEDGVTSEPVFTFVYTLFNPVENYVATGISSSEIDISWDDTNDGETGYLVEYSYDQGLTWLTGALLPADTTNYLLEVLPEATNVYTRVQARHNTQFNHSDYVVDDGNTFINTPTDLTVVTFNENEIFISWTDNSLAETRHVVTITDSMMNVVEQIFLGPNVTEATVTSSIVPAETYTLTVRAENDSFVSMESNSVVVTTALAEPTALVVVDGEIFMELSWVLNSVGEDEVVVERSTTGPGGPFTEYAVLPGGTTEYDDTLVILYQEYCYRIKVRTIGGLESSYTPVVCETKNIMLHTLNSHQLAETVLRGYENE